MLTRNVYYAERPDPVQVFRIGLGYTCRVDLPVNIREIQNDEGDTQFVADVYSVTAGYTPGIKERIEADYNGWLAVAKEIPAPQPTIQDVIEAVNELADIILGGE